MVKVPAKVEQRIVAGIKRFQPVLTNSKYRDDGEADTVTIITEQALRSLLLLEASGFKFTVLNQNGPHVRVGTFDFWPSTGRFVDRRNNKWGRTIEALLAYLRQGAEE